MRYKITVVDEELGIKVFETICDHVQMLEERVMIKDITHGDWGEIADIKHGPKKITVVGSYKGEE